MVRDDHTPGRGGGIQLRQGARNVFVGQAVEAVAAHAALGDGRRQRERLRQLGLRAVERGVEAGDLRHLRQAPGDQPDRREVMRLVQWRERHELLQLLHHPGVEPDGLRVRHAAVHHAMAHGGEAVCAAMRLQELDEVRHAAVVAEARALAPVLLPEARARRVPGGEARRRIQALEEPGKAQRELPALLKEERELDAGGARVEDEDRVGHRAGALLPCEPPATA
jgi:hypothetical protein